LCGLCICSRSTEGRWVRRCGRRHRVRHKLSKWIVNSLYLLDVMNHECPGSKCDIILLAPCTTACATHDLPRSVSQAISTSAAFETSDRGFERAERLLKPRTKEQKHLQNQKEGRYARAMDSPCTVTRTSTLLITVMTHDYRSHDHNHDHRSLSGLRG